MHPAQNRSTDDEIRALTAGDFVKVVLSDDLTPSTEAVWCEVLGRRENTLLVELNTPYEDLTTLSKFSVEALRLSGANQDPGVQFVVEHHHILCCKPQKTWVFKNLPRVPTLVDCVENSWSELLIEIAVIDVSFYADLWPSVTDDNAPGPTCLPWRTYKQSRLEMASKYASQARDSGAR